MGIKITKMQGCGNDFVILDYAEYKKLGQDMSETARKLCDRHFGFGGDGLIIPNLNVDDADIGWFFYNSDGTTAQMCGNGIRCFAKYVFDNKMVAKNEFNVKTLAGIITPKIMDDGNVKVKMSIPVTKSEKIPFIPTNNLNYKISVKNKIFTGNAVSMGNPHFVIFVDSEDNTMSLAKEYGPLIEVCSEFPEKTNVEFVKIKSRENIELSVWERGCGITLACGTGACASVVAGILNDKIEHSVDVELPGGTVHIDWKGSIRDAQYNVYMTGSAEYVYCGELV